MTQRLMGEQSLVVRVCNELKYIILDVVLRIVQSTVNGSRVR